MALLSLAILFFLPCYCCTTQEFVENTDYDSDLDIDGTEVDEVDFRCIETYYELETYVKGSREVMESLKGAFFVTGKPPTRFVRFRYNFQVSNGNISNCSNNQDTFIWSESFLDLLGPQPMRYFTLLAVVVPEKTVTINLPCLCRVVSGNLPSSLLSRLTYMVGL